jgi:BRCT domain type II-containing protein
MNLLPNTEGRFYPTFFFVNNPFSGLCTTICKKLSYAIVGEGFGAAKMKKIVDLKIKMLTEDEFLDLIRSSKPQKAVDRVDAKQNKKIEKKMEQVHLPS